jgi:hypothetical protein
MPVYRGGAKFQRALDSIREAEPFFRRVIVSLNGPLESDDATRMARYLESGRSKAEVIQTGSELPWMDHQYFWLDHLEQTGEQGRDWVYWFAHDDQVRLRGIESLVDQQGNWPLTPQTIYLGPWGMRYDPLGGMYDGPADAPLESWTSFPLGGPLRLSVGEWIAQQLEQPTYINMSGCVTQLASFAALRRFPVAKPGGMRIEMATAAAPNNLAVEEFSEPIVITHTSKGSDRTTYAAVARRDDLHMAAWLGHYILRHPSAAAPSARAATRVAATYARRALGRGDLPAEDWRYRETLSP